MHLYSLNVRRNSSTVSNSVHSHLGCSRQPCVHLLAIRPTKTKVDLLGFLYLASTENKGEMLFAVELENIEAFLVISP